MVTTAGTRSLRCKCVLAAMVMLQPNMSVARETGVADSNELLVHPFAGLVEILPAPTTDSNEAGISYTYQQTTGNRVISGRGNLPAARPVDVPLLDQPQWVVGFPVGTSTVWVVVLADGHVQAFLVTGDVVESLSSESLPYPVLSPPALTLIDGAIQLMVPPIPDGSPLTQCVPGEQLTWIGQ